VAAEPAGDAETAVGKASSQVKIRRLSGLGQKGFVKTPSFKTSANAASQQPDDWAEIKVVFDVLEKEWLDELTFHYYVLTLKDAAGGGKAYSLYETVVRYVDIEPGRKTHTSTAYLRPAAHKRFGQVVAIGVEISHNGKTVAEDSAEDGLPVPAGQRWWRIPAVVDGKGVTKREGYLLNRNQSPFALVNIEDFDTIKP
jgi:hypothetical protein